jgi:hypothetical protein
MIPEPMAGLEIARGAATIDPRFSFSFGFASDLSGAVDCSVAFTYNETTF